MPDTKQHFQPMEKEPAAIIGTISAAIVAVLGLLIAFGVDLSPEQTGAIVTAFSAVAIAIQTILTRNRVYSPKTTQLIAQQSADAGVPQVPPPPAT